MNNTQKQNMIESLKFRLKGLVVAHIGDGKQTIGEFRKQLSEKSGICDTRLAKILGKNDDFSLSELVRIALACGYVPIIEFKPIEQVIENERVQE